MLNRHFHILLRIVIKHEIVHQCREAGHPCYFTMDAGPNVKILVEKTHKQYVVEQLESYFGQDKIIASDITRSGVEIIQ